MIKIVTHSENETKRLGRALAKHLTAGAALALIGPLGGGKTAFVKGLAAGLGLANGIKSPSFGILHAHRLPRGRFDKLFHLDLYRLKSPSELRELGFTALLLEPKSLLAIEWPALAKKWLPKKRTISIRFAMGKKNHERVITFS